jgi:hypothetical protein
MMEDVRVETLAHPDRYTRAQLQRAMWIARVLERGSLVLCEPPRG